jgi:hypothetical protein
MSPRHKDIQLYHTGVRHDSVSVWVGQDSTVAELREEMGTSNCLELRRNTRTRAEAAAARAMQ